MGSCHGQGGLPATRGSLSMRLRTNDEIILGISDLQIPFQHKDAFSFLEWLNDEYEPTKVVSLGDEVDQYMLSRYAHDPDADSAGREVEKSYKELEILYSIFPVAFACLSNHVDRVLKRAVEAGIPRAYLKSIKEFMNAPEGWNWSRYWDIGGVRFEHGDSAGGVSAHRTLAISNRQSTCIGHHHSSGGVDYVANEKEMIFGLNSGCLIDIEAYAFQYAKMAKHKPTLGAAVIVYGVPHFIPMVTKPNGRWDYARQR